MEIIKMDYGIRITNEYPFQAVSDFTQSEGIDIVENIELINDESKFDPTGSYIGQKTDSLEYFINSYGSVEIITFMANDVTIQDFTDKLKVANSPKGFENARINLSHIIYINKALAPAALLKIYKDVTKSKAGFLKSLNLPFHIDSILNTDDFLAVLSNISKENDGCYDEVNLDELNISEAVEITLEEAFEKLGLSFGILDYLVSEGILIGDLVEAGMELLDGVEITEDLNRKMESQILKALSDINVIALIIAALRLEQDLTEKRISEVDISDESSHIYSGEALGLAISNQIAGTKAIINFKHYKQVQPGIIYGLPPILEDIFAGLIAGCISKVFEE